MRRLGNTVSRLTAMSSARLAALPGDDGRLVPMTGFGANPGSLDAKIYVPDNLPTGAALVVVLHGCTQNAAIYDRGSGWSTLADRHGFALLFPQQRRANNANLCFNWYFPGDARRSRGEALSISQMVEHLTATRRLDRSRRFVTGLSAGGAMTAVMLATYPELFAGGATIAGLPFASANTLPEALERMRGVGGPTRRELAALVEGAAAQQAKPPTLSVWHGSRDAIVDSANAVAIADQWRDLHGLTNAVGMVEIVDGHRREVWHDRDGRPRIEKYDVAGMGHGTPLDTRASAACGVAGPHMLEANICSTRRIAGFWGLTGTEVAQHQPHRVAVAGSTEPRADGPTVAVTPQRQAGVGAVIEDALRAAGLMR